MIQINICMHIRNLEIIVLNCGQKARHKDFGGFCDYNIVSALATFIHNIKENSAIATTV
jgi:hypothetical protein